LDSYVTDRGRVRLETDIAPLALELGQAVPFGLLLTELVSNALKHGFPERAAGCVHVGLARADGVGLPADLDARRARSLGLRLIESLSRQLRGAPELRSEGGTLFRLS